MNDSFVVGLARRIKQGPDNNGGSVKDTNREVINKKEKQLKYKKI